MLEDEDQLNQFRKSIQEIHESNMNFHRELEKTIQPITNTYQIFLEEMSQKLDISNYIKGIVEAIDWGAIRDAAVETLTELDAF